MTYIEYYYQILLRINKIKLMLMEQCAPRLNNTFIDEDFIMIHKLNSEMVDLAEIGRKILRLIRQKHVLPNQQMILPN